MDSQVMHSFIDALKNKLFEPERRRLASLIDRTVEQHEEITNRTEKGFMFAGEVYRHTQSRLIHPSWPALAWDLNGEMDKWLKDKKQIELDEAQIGQLLYRLQSAVMNSGTEQQLQEERDALPECLVALVPKFRGRPRTFNVQFFLKSDRDFRQYAKLLPKIEMYAMASLIY